MKQSLELLKKAIELAGAERLDEALACVTEGVRIAREQGEASAVSLLSRNAGVLCAHAGRLAEAAEHYEAAARAEPDSAYIEWALGDVYEASGDHERASSHWRRFAELARASSDPDLDEMLQRHLARRPESSAT